MPIMSNIVALFTKEENKSSISSTSMAPIKAPAKVLKYPVDIKSKPMLDNPPPNNMIKATPRLAPVEMPRIEGSASGLLNTVWRSNPHTAKAEPAKIAVIIVGMRD